MSVEENKAVALRIYEAFNAGDLTALDELFAPEYVEHILPLPGQPAGREGVKYGIRLLRTAFPDLRFTVEDQIGEGDRGAARYTVTGTHRGEFMGIPATGKSIRVSGIDIGRVANGKVVEHWGEFDMLGLMQQLGVVPSPGQGGG